MSKVWKAVEILRAYAVYRRYEPHELDFILTKFEFLNPEKPEDELSDKEVAWIKKLYKQHIVIKGWE